MLILAGDIGGTNTRLALFDENKKELKKEVFSSKDHKSLKEIIQKFQTDRVDKACFGIAGPIKDNTCHATNLPWIIDGNAIKSECKFSQVYLINDLLANAYGIRALKEEEMFVVNKGNSQKGNGALVSPGTGLGEAGLFWNGEEMNPFPSEGGHADFAPRNREEIELFEFLQSEYGHVSYERVLSGPGTVNIYRFLTEKKGKKGFQKTIDELELPKAITKGGLEGSPEAAKLTLEWFISLLGAEVGNTALKFLAVSGVYIGGGIAPRICKKMLEGSFMKAYRDKGRFENFVKDVPVKVIMNDKTALLGAMEYALIQEKE